MIQVYYANIYAFLDEAYRNTKMNMVCKQRRDKILRCKSSEDKARSITAGLLLRYAVEQLGYTYEELVFGSRGHGDIIIENASSLYLNLSHSGNYAVCAIANQQIGIDIEQIERGRGDSIDRNWKVAKRCFVEEELALLEGIEEKAFKKQFTKIWTRKESYSKAFGLGMQIDFSTINTQNVCYFYEFTLEEQYQVSVALPQWKDQAKDNVESDIQIQDGSPKLLLL